LTPIVPIVPPPAAATPVANSGASRSSNDSGPNCVSTRGTFLSDNDNQTLESSGVGYSLDTNDYKMGMDEEQTNANRMVGRGPAWSFTNNNKSEENNRMHERSQRGRRIRLSRRMGRKKVRDVDTGSARGLLTELVASRSPAGSGKDTDTMLLYDRSDGNRTLTEGTSAHRSSPVGAKANEASIACRVSIQSCS
jgi:hypothetical protein